MFNSVKFYSWCCKIFYGLWSLHYLTMLIYSCSTHFDCKVLSDLLVVLGLNWTFYLQKEEHKKMLRPRGFLLLSVMILTFLHFCHLTPLCRVAFAMATWLSVCLCVCHKLCCVSVTLTYCAQMTQSIIMRPSQDYIPAILVVPYQMRS